MIGGPKTRRFHLRSQASPQIAMCGLYDPVTAEHRRALSPLIDMVPVDDGLAWLIVIPTLDVAVVVCASCAELHVRRAHAEHEILKKLDAEGRVVR